MGRTAYRLSTGFCPPSHSLRRWLGATHSDSDAIVPRLGPTRRGAERTRRAPPTSGPPPVLAVAAGDLMPNKDDPRRAEAPNLAHKCSKSKKRKPQNAAQPLDQKGVAGIAAYLDDEQLRCWPIGPIRRTWPSEDHMYRVRDDESARQRKLSYARRTQIHPSRLQGPQCTDKLTELSCFRAGPICCCGPVVGLSLTEAHRIAANIAKPPELSRRT
jgi:hypothetical protein